MQLLKAFTPATGSVQASSHTTASRPGAVERNKRGRAGSSSTVVLLP